MSPTSRVTDTPLAVPTGEPGPLVAAPCGPVRGEWRRITTADASSRYRRSAAFYGIPYAEEPTGGRRLMAPVPRARWAEERDATVPGATPQRGSIFDDPAIPEPSVPGDDVLNLNVFTPVPGDESARLPVYVWIHGGGWTSGSHNSPWYDGAAFNRDGVVTVSVAYRLGFDGYGWVDGSDAPFNRAVLDQVTALEWVRDNIAAFGGNPGDVTIGGQSAGGGNSLVLMSVPRATGLFHKVISESGAVPDRSAEETRANSGALGAVLGVAPTLEGFRSATYDEVFDASNRIADQSVSNDPDAQPEAPADPADGNAGQAGPDPAEAVRNAVDGLGESLAFIPTVDGEVVSAPLADALASGQGSDVAVLAGSTTHDFAFAGFAYAESASGRDPRGILTEAGIPAELADAYLAHHPEHADAPHLIVGDLVSDSTFHLPLVEWFEARERAQGGTAGQWVYEFAYACGPAHLAYHCTEIPFAFDCLAEPYCEHTLGAGAPQEVADAVHGAWLRFITTGTPGWPQWTADAVGRRFGDNLTGGLVVEQDVPTFVVERDLLRLCEERAAS